MTDRPTRSYSTRFETDEDPLSEGGAWLNGKSDGIDWTDVYVADGAAIGALCRMSVAERRAEQGNLGEEDAAPEGDYDDPTAVLTGEWGPNQHGKAEVYCRNPTGEYFQEVQIRVRHTMRANWCTGYEFIWRCLKTDEGYAEIVRWNGEVGDWTSLQRVVGAQYGVQDGDIVEGVITGSVLTGFVNGVEVISVSDDTFATGAPGIGFNFGMGDTNVDHGFRSFEVDTFDA